MRRTDGTAKQRRSGAGANGRRVLSALAITAVLAGPVCAEVTVSMESGGSLVVDGTTRHSNDEIVLRRDAARYEVAAVDGELKNLASGTVARSVAMPPEAAADAAVIVNLGGGDDRLTVDLSAGDLPAPVRYDGGAGGFDTLALTAGDRRFETVTFEYLNRSDGSVRIAGNGPIHYVGLEPITSTINASSVQLNYSTSAETITVSNPSPTTTTVASTAGEVTTFTNPSSSMTIRAGDTGDDIIDVNSLAAGFPPSLTINGDGGTDTVNFNGALSFGPSSFLTVTAETVNILGGSISTGQDQSYFGAVDLPDGSTLTGSVIVFGGELTPTGASTIVGAMTLTSSAELIMAIDGTTPGTDFDQLAVSTGIALDGNLTPNFGFTPADGDSFVLLDNDGSGPIIGTFTGLAEGATVATFGSIEVTISYVGGDGNDLVLLAADTSGDDDPPVPVELESFKVGADEKN